jgi:uncharacterized protein
MKINVSQLLKQPLGTTRNISVAEQIANKAGESCGVEGELSITRTGKGLFVSGELTIDDKGTCGRCLETFEYAGKLKVEEEFLPTVDIVTGLPLEARDDAFQIDEHHQIDIGDILYQYACMSVPMKLVCKEDCAGICPTCGKNLNKGKCRCSQQIVDKRWAKLAALRKEGKK